MVTLVSVTLKQDGDQGLLITTVLVFPTAPSQVPYKAAWTSMPIAS